MNWSYGRSVVIHVLPLTKLWIAAFASTCAVYRPSELRRNYQLSQELITSPVCIASSYLGGKITDRPSLTVGDQPGAVGGFGPDLRVGIVARIAAIRSASTSIVSLSDSINVTVTSVGASFADSVVCLQS